MLMGLKEGGTREVVLVVVDRNFFYQPTFVERGVVRRDGVGLMVVHRNFFYHSTLFFYVYVIERGVVRNDGVWLMVVHRNLFYHPTLLSHPLNVVCFLCYTKC